MAQGDPWIRARSDRPTHFTIGDCLPGRLGLRWAVFSSTGIHHCSLLDLEDGVIVKYDRERSFTGPVLSTTWFREDTDLGVEYTCIKTTTTSPSLFGIVVRVLPSCILRIIETQPIDEELLTSIEATPPDQLGVCDVDPMLDNLKVEFYATEDDALDDWPDAKIWVWE